MTCAACAARIEKRLNRLDGVEATVNLATERATVRFDPARVAVPDLIGAVEAAGYGAHVHRAGEDAVDPGGARATGRRLVLAVLLTVPVAAVAMIPALQFGHWAWVALALSAPVVLVAGFPFHRVALTQARHGGITMDSLVSLGTLVSFGWSASVLALGLHTHTYFEAAAVITTLILLGRSLEGGARRRSRDATRALLELAAKDARILRDGIEIAVPAAELVPGDLFVVRPGEKLATDGIVVEGSSAVDASLLTGEPEPVDAGPGDAVVGGTINTYGRLVVRATHVGSQTALAQIARLVERAQGAKAPVQRLADRISAVFVPFVVAVAAATLAGWLLSGAGAATALTAAVSVLVVACPCALGLATPTAIAVGTARGARLGIVIKGPEVLELARRLTTVVLDKTGTLTEGRLELVGVEQLDGTTRAEALRLAGAVEAASEHPVAAAVVAAARTEVGSLPPVEGFRAVTGVGVAGTVEGRLVEVGRGGGSSGGVEVSWGGAVHARLELADRLKPTSAEAVAALRALGLTTVLLTGDRAEEASRIAAEVGVDRVVAGVLPEGKLAEIERLRATGEVVAMVGDGVNDAAALAGADLGIALGSGADVAIEAADVTLVSGDLRGAVDAVRLARRTLGTIRGNLFWAFAYNAAAIPVAAAGLLDPMIAAGAMACSSLFVVGNSLRLFRFSSVRGSAA